MNKLFKIHQKEARRVLTNFLLGKERIAKNTAPEVFFLISEIQKNIFQNEFDNFLPEVEEFFLSIISKNKKSAEFIVAGAWLTNFFLQKISRLAWNNTAAEGKDFEKIICNYQRKSDPKHIKNSQILILSDVVSGFIYDVIMSSTLTSEKRIAVCEKIANFLEEQHLKRVNDLRK